jgi:nucleoid-associated protein YgaU
MAKEMKIGIAVIGLLLIVFCGLLAKRLTRPSKLPLGNINAPATSNNASTAGKGVAQSARPIVVTPQADSFGGSNLTNNLGTSSRSETNWTKQSDRYAATAWSPNETGGAGTSSAKSTAPHLLATPLPIQDLEAKSLDASGKAVPYRSGYPATDMQDANHKQPADVRQAKDPFQRQTTAGARSTTSVEPVTPPRYPDYTANPGGRVPDASSQYDYRQSVGSPPSTAITNYQNQQYTSGHTRPPYSTDSLNPTIPSRTAVSTGSAPPAYGAGYSSTGANSLWSGAAIAGDNLPSNSVAPIQRDGEKYSVQPNDTFWAISEKAYGSGGFFKALYEYNRKRHKAADELVVGQELLVPDENVLRRHYPDLCPRTRKEVASTEQRLISVSTKLRGNGRVYKVVEGDTLYEIARYELGKSSRWAEIYELNRDVLGDDFDYLRPGTELILPVDGPRTDGVTRQPEHPVPNNYWRY